jgi:hypothetical protein
MKTSITKLLSESETLLRNLRVRNRELPWCASPQMIRAVKQVQRVLKGAQMKTERIHLSHELTELMGRTQGIWRAIRGHTPAPGWLKEGRVRQQGETSDTAITNFFQQMRIDSELRSATEKLWQRSWRECERLYSLAFFATTGGASANTQKSRFEDSALFCTGNEESFGKARLASKRASLSYKPTTTT